MRNYNVTMKHLNYIDFEKYIDYKYMLNFLQVIYI